MAVSDLLKEYLIALGFNVKDDEYRKFLAGIAKSEKGVLELGTAATTTATAIGYMVEKAARQYTDLYYVSQRTGQSVAFLKAYEFAAGQVGVTAEEARGSTEAFFATLRTNPGMQGLLGNLGVAPGGGPLDMVEALKKRFGTMGDRGYMVASRFAQMFGMDEQTFRQFWTNADRMEAAQTSQIKRQQDAGVATTASTAAFLKYSLAVNQLGEDFNNLETRIGMDFVWPATKVVEVIDNIIQAFSRLDNATGGAAGVAGTVAGSALAAVLFKKILFKVLRMLGIGGAAETAVADTILAEAGLGGAAAAVGMGALATAGLVAGGAAALYFGMTTSTAGPEDDEPLSAAYRAKHGGGSTPGAGSRGDRNNNPGNIEYSRWAVLHGAVGSDGRFAIFPSEQVGQAAMDALLQNNYSGLTLAQIQQKWVGNSDANYLGDMEKSTGLGANDAPNMADPKMRQALMGGMTVGEGTHLTPSPMAVASAPVTINHDTDINIYGNADETAQKNIFDAQADIYAQAVRNNLPRTR